MNSITLNVPMTFTVNKDLAAKYNNHDLADDACTASPREVTGFLRAVVDEALRKYQRTLMGSADSIVSIGEDGMLFVRLGKVKYLSFDIYKMFQQAQVKLERVYDENKLPYEYISHRLAKQLLRFLLKHPASTILGPLDYDHATAKEDIAVICDELLSIAMDNTQLGRE